MKEPDWPKDCNNKGVASSRGLKFERPGMRPCSMSRERRNVEHLSIANTTARSCRARDAASYRRLTARLPPQRIHRLFVSRSHSSPQDNRPSWFWTLLGFWRCCSAWRQPLWEILRDIHNPPADHGSRAGRRRSQSEPSVRAAVPAGAFSSFSREMEHHMDGRLVSPSARNCRTADVAPAAHAEET